MFSIVAGADFRYDEMNLRELRDKIVTENGLTAIDIAKGFHDVAVIKYPKFKIELSEEEQDAIKDIYDSFLSSFINGDVATRLQKEYDEIYQREYAILKEAYDNSDISTPLEEIIATANKHYCGGTAFRNIFDDFYHKVFSRWSYRFNKTEGYVRELFRSYIEEHYGLTKYVPFDIPDDGWTTPSIIELNNCGNYDYTKFYLQVSTKEVDSLSDIAGLLKIEYQQPYNKEKSIFSVPIPSLYIHVDEELIRKAFEDAIVAKATSLIGNVSMMEFAQNLEAMPITINISTKTGRYELIDGYKRLLCTTQQELLDLNAPVRVFTDLDDKGFIALLYATNLWKKSSKSKNVSFHDRGFLFALKTRFGFEIPKGLYALTGWYSPAGRCYENELDLLRMYDFGCTGNGFCPALCRDYMAEILEEKGLTYYSQYDNLKHRTHLVDDIRFLYNDYYEIINKDYGYDNNIRNYIASYIVQVVGIIRRLSNEEIQNPLSEEIIIKIMLNPAYVKVFAKKHFSSDTYVSNFLVDKGYLNLIFNDILEGLTK